MSLQKALLYFSKELEPFSDSPRLDAQILILFVTGISREKMIGFPELTLNSEQEKKLQELILRRKNGEPIAYIIGHKEFWSMDLRVSPDTLIPRPETESLIEWVLQHFPDEKRLVADLGTGSGAIAIALADERRHFEIHATDINANALSIAKINADHYVAGRISFFEGAWCEALPTKNYDLIISNPPYIREKDPHLTALQFEPTLALVSGKSGLDAIRKIAQEAQQYLRPGGYLVLEHGYDQADAVCKILQNFSYNDIEAYRDLGGSPRFVVGEFR